MWSAAGNLAEDLEMVLSNLTNYMSNYVRFQAFLAVPYVLLKPEVVRFWQRRSLLEC